jgi:hypothetical protein
VNLIDARLRHQRNEQRRENQDCGRRSSQCSRPKN